MDPQTSNIQPQNKIENPSHKSQRGKPYDLRERLYIFSKRIMQLCRMLPKTPECEVIRKQLAKAGTSIGANFEEADGSLTKKDFVNKVAIARKEAKETKYWLRIISGNCFCESKIQDDDREIEEIICILSAILKKSGYRFRL